MSRAVLITGATGKQGGAVLDAWVAVSDVGAFAAKALENPEAWNHKVTGLAGDQATFEPIDAAFHEVHAP
ncbi:uncharacterized protein BO97DRAFT_424849 [Aspergillus homomorphus CBS 101889]|uniref:NmrA-like domain-containing protein n=1 Tax=Aspergillus homomorphus (strain CBS 101889) TaxID=1450537 RepID=A0A395HZM1_ASPHC|nr:hypothetical protein BO97DRAFT_424849 [Aspergillus homomorphus CBS 101889]RAL12328.1 hypothetical protein BO97DRAFT_424849 [Aspergillus homomorphus CBS 101889]